MAKLKATRAVLYLNRLYEAGDELPEDEPAMVNAWLEAGSAIRETDEVKTAPTPGLDNAKASVKASRTATSKKGTVK